MALNRFLFAALVALPFLSKLSFRWLGFIPEKLSIFLMQGGLHPLVNSAASVALLAIAIRMRWRLDVPFMSPAEQAASGRAKGYWSFLVLLVLTLLTQAAFQASFLELNVSTGVHVVGVVLTILLVIGYGIVVPALGSTERLFSILLWVTRIGLALSFLILLVKPGLAFKGSRFIGTFKHIPYMVTCAQIAMMVEAYSLFAAPARHKLVSVFFIGASFAALLLTGTRSALIGGVIFMALACWKWPIRTSTATWGRRAAGYLAVIFALTLGPYAYVEGEAFLKGQSSFALRPAQDGIASRLEEVERGLAMFEKEPVFGHGLLHRFGSESLESAGSYNSFKDPHNLFVSAGVIGGWPLIVWTMLAGIFLVWTLMSRLTNSVTSLADYRLTLICAYLLSHLPILVIYHMHLSLGGLADRIYWLFFGFVFMSAFEKPDVKTSENTEIDRSA